MFLKLSQVSFLSEVDRFTQHSLVKTSQQTILSCGFSVVMNVVPAEFVLQRLESTQHGTFQQVPQGHARWYGMSGSSHQRSPGQWVLLVRLLKGVMITL